MLEDIINSLQKTKNGKIRILYNNNNNNNNIDQTYDNINVKASELSEELSQFFH